MSISEDAILVERALKGDSRAFDALMDLYYSSVYSLALRIVRDIDEAYDIAQEAFLQAYLNLDTLKDRTKFSTWVLSIASNLSKNWILRYKNRRMSLDNRPMGDLPGDTRTPESDYVRGEERWFVANALFSLLKEDRDLLIQFYFRGMSYREIAEYLGVSEQVVQGRLQAARDRLKGKIAQTVDDVLDEALSGRSFPTRLHIGRSSKNIRKFDADTDVQHVFFGGIPRVIKVGSVYKAWVVCLPARSDIFSVPHQIVHLTSQDGIHWTNRGSVFEVHADPSSDRFDRYGIGGHCVLYDGSFYRMWYTGYMREQGGEQKIGCSISPDGLEWERISGPCEGGAVLDKGEANGYDGEGVCAPFVMVDEGMYKMWYGAIPKERDADRTHHAIHIAYAESRDGVVWEKRGVVLSPGGPGDFDRRWIYPGSVVRDGDMYRMWYTTDDDVRRVYAIGYASSSDGVVWNKQGKVLGGESPFDVAKFPSVVWDEEERRIWYRTLEGIACVEWESSVGG